MDEFIENINIRLIKLENHVSKLHDILNMEDRITACDVLNRLTLLEDKLVQIDKVQENINDLVCKFRTLKSSLGKLAEETESHRPYKCPVCNGTTFCDEGMGYIACEGEGIVWSNNK